jgi:hypothetical protein
VLSGWADPNELSDFRWINILLSNLKASLSGTFHAFNYRYASLRLRQVPKRYLGGFCFRFNRRFERAAMTERIAHAVCCCRPWPEGPLRVVEVNG